MEVPESNFVSEAVAVQLQLPFSYEIKHLGENGCNRDMVFMNCTIDKSKLTLDTEWSSKPRLEMIENMDDVPTEYLDIYFDGEVGRFMLENNETGEQYGVIYPKAQVTLDGVGLIWYIRAWAASYYNNSEF